jgi:tRNA nucleotidyltransferase/poly(A) polymerase
MHEVTTFRRDVQTDGRHAVVEFGASLEDDLARRDFTINAIAFSPITGEIRDPFGGKKDLELGVLRAVGVPDERMQEDRLRALRGIRFAARFGFAIEPVTWQAIVKSAPHLTRLSRERVKQEIEKTMEQVRAPSTAFSMWKSSGALASLVPPLAAQDEAAFASADYIAMPDYARAEKATSRRMHRVLSLFLGLPYEAVRRALHDLRFSNADIRTMARLAELWTPLFDAMTAALVQNEAPNDATIRKWAAATGRTQLASFIRVSRARWCALRQAGKPAPSLERIGSVYRRALRIAYRDPIEQADLAVDGEDLQVAGIARGPALGKILRALVDWVVEHPGRNTRDQLLHQAARLAGEGGHQGDAE